jgi:hypothetical protein
VVRIVIDSQYHRDQFDDWLAGGRVEYEGRMYHWSGYDSGYGFGWEIEPVGLEGWETIAENQFEQVIELIKDCLHKHRREFVFSESSLAE